MADENRYNDLWHAECRLRAFLSKVRVLQGRKDLRMDEHARDRLRALRKDFQKTSAELDELQHKWGVFNE